MLGRLGGRVVGAKGGSFRLLSIYPGRLGGRSNKSMNVVFVAQSTHKIKKMAWKVTRTKKNGLYRKNGLYCSEKKGERLK